MPESVHFTEIQDQAALFALGAFPPDETRAFQRRLDTQCPLCIAEARECEDTVGKLALATAEVAPPAGLRARLLDRIQSADSAARKPMAGEGVLVRSSDTPWEPASIPGIHVRRLLERKTMLVRMDPHTTYPEHEHHRNEQCLVLQGDVSSAGVTAYAGDYIFMPAGSSHDSLYSKDGCIFLIAYT